MKLEGGGGAETCVVVLTGSQKTGLIENDQASSQKPIKSGFFVEKAQFSDMIVPVAAVFRLDKRIRKEETQLLLSLFQKSLPVSFRNTRESFIFFCTGGAEVNKKMKHFRFHGRVLVNPGCDWNSSASFEWTPSNLTLLTLPSRSSSGPPTA